MQGTITLSTSFIDSSHYNKAVETFKAMGFEHVPEKSYMRPSNHHIGEDAGITLAFPKGSAEKVLELIAFATTISQGFKVEKCELEPTPARQAA